MSRRDSQLFPRPHRDIVVRDAIRWYDGMPLSPQHFQESFRRIERLIDYQLDHLSPYHYGVVSLDIDAASLSGCVLTVACEAVLPDRLVARTAHPISVPLDPGELRKTAESSGRRASATPFDVYLAVPSEHPGRTAAGEDPRYLMPSDGDRVTDDTTAEGDLEVHRLVPNVRIVVGLAPPPDSAWIRLTRLHLEGDAIVRTDYVPPTLVVSEDSPIFERCRRLVEGMRNLANRLGERISILSQNTDVELILETRRNLYHLTAALPPFEAMLFTRKSHPYPLYVALSAIVGHLAPLATSPVPPRPPPYQHDDLEACFAELDATIQRMIREGIHQSFRAHPFDLDGELFRIDFAADWTSRTVVVAVRERRGAAPNEVKRWMEGAIIAPLRVARDLQKSRALGIEREIVPRKDDLVPTSDEALFELRSLRRHITTDEPLVVFNPAPGSNEIRPAEVVLYVKERPDLT